MAYFILKLKNGDIVRITESEYRQIGGKQGLIFFPSNKETVDTVMIGRILSEEQYNLELRENRTKSINGVLHTGEKAIRYFGQWYLDDGIFLDDPKTGRPTKPEKLVDPKYYPEVACDCVFLVEEYNKVKHLPQYERLKIALGGKETKRIKGGGFTKIHKLCHLEKDTQSTVGENKQKNI